jgi:hypothetical protein
MSYDSHACFTPASCWTDANPLDMAASISLNSSPYSLFSDYNCISLFSNLKYIPCVHHAHSLAWGTQHLIFVQKLLACLVRKLLRYLVFQKEILWIVKCPLLSWLYLKGCALLEGEGCLLVFLVHGVAWEGCPLHLEQQAKFHVQWRYCANKILMRCTLYTWMLQ